MKKIISDFELEGKRVIIRCDLNVPLVNNVIADDTRIRMSIRTIKYAISNGAKIILLSHLGRVKTEEDKKGNSLYPVSIRLSELLGKKVLFSYDTRSASLSEMVNNLENGDVLLVENTRFEDLDGKKESNCDLDLAKYWASLGDIFINDAYGSCHRNHASVTGIPKYIPSGIGFLVQKEIKKIDGVINSKMHPFVVILGGKKVDDKIGLIEKIAGKADKLLIGGAMSFTFLKALDYETGSSVVSLEYVDFAKRMLEEYKDKIVLPKDFVVINKDNEVETKDITEFEEGDVGFDIGPKSVNLFKKELEKARRVIFNGPMGQFEDKRFAKGTEKIFRILDKNKIKTIVGGGDSASAASKLGYEDAFYHLSTGGGATMKYIENGKLIGIEAVEDEKEES